MIARASCAIAVVACVATLPLRADASSFGPGVIAAIVRDAAGKPVPGALVVAQGPARRAATTSNAGIVTLLGLPIGDYAVRITRVGYATATRRVEVTSDPQTSALQVSVARTSLARAQGIASTVETARVAEDVGTSASAVIETTPEAALVPVRGALAGAAPALAGTSANETRVELDGIPIAGGATSLAALRFRSVVGLETIAFERGPVVASPTVQNAIGGIVDYRTASFDEPATAAAEFGYSSTFGAFQHLATVRSSGRLSVVADALTGGGEDRTQTLKARYDLSRATALGVATYGSQSSATIGGVDVSTIAPAYAADLRTSLGDAVVQLRTFGSAVSTTGLAGTNETAVTRGFSGSLDVPVGETIAAFGFDRRRDALQNANGALERTTTSVTARSEFALTKASRLEIGDDYSGGTSLAPRNDPHVALALHPNDRTTVRVSAGSSYAVAPGDLLLARPRAVAPLAPETAFGYRISLDDALDNTDRLDVSLFDLRRYDRFATSPVARTLGLDLGFAHRPAGPGFAGDADLVFERVRAYGPLQPVARVADGFDDASSQLAGIPFYTFQTRLAYATKRGYSLSVGNSLLGANNALASRALGFTNVGANLPLLGFASVRLGENNVFATRVAEPSLAPYYAPREFTLVVRFGTPPR